MPAQLNSHTVFATLTGVVLAGGEARRMGGQDKGLVLFRGRPLAAYALDALAAVAGQVRVNANRHQAEYAKLGYPVIGDGSTQFNGPLAGMLAALRTASTPHVLIVPCDCPLLRPDALRRLYLALLENQAEAAVAYDGERLHPVFAALDRRLATSLQSYLDQGQRKVEYWLRQHNPLRVDFSGEPELFRNANTPEELAALENYR
jgi:molybdopterin-guanine dinucleotide biosynthesis protein A